MINLDVCRLGVLRTTGKKRKLSTRIPWNTTVIYLYLNQNDMNNKYKFNFGKWICLNNEIWAFAEKLPM